MEYQDFSMTLFNASLNDSRATLVSQLFTIKQLENMNSFFQKIVVHPYAVCKLKETLNFSIN